MQFPRCCNQLLQQTPRSTLDLAFRYLCISEVALLSATNSHAFVITMKLFISKEAHIAQRWTNLSVGFIQFRFHEITNKGDTIFLIIFLSYLPPVTAWEFFNSLL